ncbi:phosphoglycolate phosphatase [Hydrogenophaga crassostreae]|uniref:Phosphoglycolate phosphatase n=1 Tax=Hydrogenophaga crassostreae TaxID=1763535 RepID=A0A162VSI0_9BURK|nr:HAD-IA family hydrolase [Hydrogenophaga crassostreae]AOW12984.1 phosphoglycolate phosphatase [Hydrogenophaga crassostreae]OAD40166.1 phosphoglycolate phosphatase [Hydrogenophaga crassostreae]
MATPAKRFAGVRAVLFDLDGTLIDSAPDLAAAADAMRVKSGLPSLPLSEYRSHAGSGARGMLRVAFGIGPEDASFDARKRTFFDEYEACLTARTVAFAGVQSLVDRLLSAGLAWGVVTNKAERFSLPLTAAMPLFNSASAIVSGDTTPHAKPHPAPLFEAARRVGVLPGQCLYVGDDLRDIQAGQAAGMPTVAACYGYLGPDADVDSWKADAGIHSPADLLKLLELP